MTIENLVAPKLIGIRGKAGSGKSAIATYLHNTRPNTWTEAFADPLKQVASLLFGIPIDYFNDRDFKEVPFNFWGISPRQVVQFVGTEMVRDTLYKLLPEVENNFWVARMVGRLAGELDNMEYTKDDVVVIPDVRFQNEYNWVLAQGGIIIHLTRPGADGIVGIPSHQSEHGIGFTHTTERNWIIENTGSLDDLYANVDKAVSHYSIYPLTLTNPDSF